MLTLLTCILLVACAAFGRHCLVLVKETCHFCYCLFSGIEFGFVVELLAILQGALIGDIMLFHFFKAELKC